MKKDEAVDLKALVSLLETEVGFAPVTDVTLQARGRLVREGGARLDVGGGRSFAVERVEGTGESPPEKQDLAVVASLVDPHSPDRVVIREWKIKREASPAP